MTVDELSLLIDDGPIYALSGDTVHKVRLFIVTEGLIEEITQRVGNVCKMRMTPDRKYLVIRGYQHNHKRTAVDVVCRTIGRDVTLNIL